MAIQYEAAKLWNITKGIVYLTVGSLIGLGVTGIVNACAGPMVEEARIYQENGKSVLRLYREGTDQILIGDKENKGKYITLENYIEKYKEDLYKKTE